MRGIGIILTLALLITSRPSVSQDIHFTEFFAAPLFTSPALTGQFEGTYRFAGIVRRQWGSVTAQPFQTFGGSVDINKPFNWKRLGIGLRISHDFVGLSSLTTTSIAIPLALKFKLGAAQNTTLAIGAQAEFFQKSIDYSKLSFGDQFYNNQFDPNWQTAESPRSGNVNKLNYSGGIYVEKRISERKRLGIGISSFNLNRPNISRSPGFENRLDLRHNIHIFSSININSSNFDLMPAGQYQMQGIHRELLFGSAIRYHLANEPLSKRSVQMGVWWRTNDAANISIGFSKNNLFAGASYDFNLSGLRVASNGLGGWEFSIIYTISTVREKIKRARMCPDFL